MKSLRFLFLMLTALSVFALYIITSTTSPYNVSINIKFMFFSAVFGAVFGLYNLILLSSPQKLASAIRPKSSIIGTFRQAFLIGIVIVTLLLLKSLNTLGLLDILLIIIAACLFELFFRVRVPLSSHEVQK